MRGGADPKQTWSIAGGLIHCTGRPLGYMRTLQSYQNYQVTVEYRFVNPGNTGVLVQINLPDQMNPWPKCIECQGLHNHLGDFWFWGGSSCTELRALGVKASGRRHNEVPRPGPSTEKPSGEWNTYTIIASGSTVQTWVNGVLVNQATNCTVTSGFIGLQSEGAKLEVRRVTLEPAPATLAPFTPPAPAAPPAPSATPPLPAASLAPAKSL
jgi:hypothetical protein